MAVGTGARPLSRGYRRDAHVEREIADLLALPPSERRRRILSAEIVDEGVSPEAAVYFIREWERAGDAESAWHGAHRLALRLKKRITRALLAMKSLSPADREEVEEALIERFYRVWRSVAPPDEFWEIRFAVALDRALADEIDRVMRHAKHETTLAAEEGSDLDPWDAFADARAMAPERAALIADALARLGEPVRTAFWLTHRLDWTEQEIADHLGCTSRTVRNYLRRARDILAEWRGTET